MSQFLDNLNWQTGPEIRLTLPSDPHITGKLHLSRNGYVYSALSKPIIWLKFLGLGLYLPLQGCISKCIEIAQRLLKHPIPTKSYQDLDHVYCLAKIAWKGVVGWEDRSLLDRVEEFALAEIDYNNSNRKDELNIPRSIRLTEGKYVAKCMQPLFHKNQFVAPNSLRKRIEDHQQIQEQLLEALRQKQPNRGWLQSTMHRIIQPANPYLEWSDENIHDALDQNVADVTSLERLLEQAERCQKYASLAIIGQQNCATSRIKKAFRDNFLETQAEVTCFGDVCFRQEKICGILYKIDCCATRCWALDCFCCFCCFWPEGHSTCII